MKEGKNLKVYVVKTKEELLATEGVTEHDRETNWLKCKSQDDNTFVDDMLKYSGKHILTPTLPFNIGGCMENLDFSNSAWNYSRWMLKEYNVIGEAVALEGLFGIPNYSRCYIVDYPNPFNDGFMCYFEGFDISTDRPFYPFIWLTDTSLDDIQLYDDGIEVKSELNFGCSSANPLHFTNTTDDYAFVDLDSPNNWGSFTTSSTVTKEEMAELFDEKFEELKNLIQPRISIDQLDEIQEEHEQMIDECVCNIVDYQNQIEELQAAIRDEEALMYESEELLSEIEAERIKMED